MTFPLNEMYGYSRLCDRLRSSTSIWKQVSLRSSAIYDPRSSAIRDRLRSFAIIWKPAFKGCICVSFDYLKNRTILSMSVPVFFFLWCFLWDVLVFC